METLNQITTTFGVTWPKLFAQGILFVLVYWLLSKFAFGPVLAMLEERRKRIEEAQQNAEKVKRQLAEAELRYQEIMRKANDGATKLLDEARKLGEEQSQRASQQAIKDAESIISRAHEEIGRDRAKMMEEVRGELAGIIVETTAKVVGKVLSPEDQKRLAIEASAAINTK